MQKKHLTQAGFSAIEAILILVIVGAISGVGYYVYHASQKTTDTYNSSTEVSNTNTAKIKKSTAATTTAPASGSDDSGLQSDLNAATTGSNQSSQDLSNSNASLNDTSTYTSN